MELCRVVLRRGSLVLSGLVSVAFAVGATAMVVRPGTIETAPTMLLLVLIGLLALPLLTLWAMRVDNETRQRTARAELASLASPADEAEPAHTSRRLHQAGRRRAVTHRATPGPHTGLTALDHDLESVAAPTTDAELAELL